MRRYPLREQIYYRYSNEDNEGVLKDEIRFHPKQSYRYPEKSVTAIKERAPFFLIVNSAAQMITSGCFSWCLIMVSAAVRWLIFPDGRFQQGKAVAAASGYLFLL